MAIQIDINVFFDALGLVQGVTLGVILLFIHKRNKQSTLFLGLFVLFYAIDIVYPILYESGVINQKPAFSFFPIQFSKYLFSFLYIYVQQISILSDRKYSYWTFIPPSIESVLNIIAFVCTYYGEQPVEKWEWVIGYRILCAAFSLYVGFLTIKWINRHIETLKEEYSNIEFKELKWVKLFVSIGLYYTIIAYINDVLFENPYIYTLLTMLNTILLYWVSIRAIMQKDVIPLISNDKANKKYAPFNPISDDIIPQTLEAQERDINILKAIEIFVIDQKAYTRPDLTIVDVAEATNTHPRLISTLINTHRNQNFNTYINSFRIKKAEELLNSPESAHLTVEGIGYEVGFKSKSAFYAAFKQFTQQTPSQFKKSIK